jgi:hypothetical protein
MTEPKGDLREVKDVLARLPADRHEEVLHRVGNGDIPFLPEDVTMEVGRGHFPGVGWIAVPGFDPAKLPIADVELFFLIARGSEYVLEVSLKSPSPPPSNEFKAMAKISAFRTKNKLERYLRKASPQVVAEVRSRAKRGHLAFLPDQLEFDHDRIYLKALDTWLPAPGLDPDALPKRNLLMMFVIPTADGRQVAEYLWQTN